VYLVDCWTSRTKTRCCRRSTCLSVIVHCTRVSVIVHCTRVSVIVHCTRVSVIVHCTRVYFRRSLVLPPSVVCLKHRAMSYQRLRHLPAATNDRIHHDHVDLTWIAQRDSGSSDSRFLGKHDKNTRQHKEHTAYSFQALVCVQAYTRQRMLRADTSLSLYIYIYIYIYIYMYIYIYIYIYIYYDYLVGCLCVF
jgi:hypothetical protein